MKASVIDSEQKYQQRDENLYLVSFMIEVNSYKFKY